MILAFVRVKALLYFHVYIQNEGKLDPGIMCMCFTVYITFFWVNSVVFLDIFMEM